MSYVIDASVILSLGIDPSDGVFAPHLIDIEFASLVRKEVIRGQRSPQAAELEILSWSRNSVIRVAHAPYLARIWDLRHNITPYDASYVALAEYLGVPLLTADRRLATAAGGYCEVVTVD